MTGKNGVHSIIVEDDPGVTFFHELILEESRFAERIDTFDKVKPALRFLEDLNKNTEPVIIFLDINMPALNGWDFLEELKVMDIKRPVFVVMVTSSINISDREKAHLYKVVIEYVEKPLSLEICQKLKLNDDLKSYF